MTPKAKEKAKEKAIELVEKFTPLVEYWDFCNCELRINEDILKDAKQCAIIAVEEIIIEYRVLMIETAFCYDQFKYWQEVKTEIEKL